jgi:flavin prenyltransferase
LWLPKIERLPKGEPIQRFISDNVHYRKTFLSKRIIIGITGASGVIYGIKLLSFLKEKKEIETHLIISDAGKKNIEIETEYKVNKIKELSNFIYNNDDTAAAPASGSFLTEGMIILPCTIKTLSAIANSYTVNLITRAADVMLKEKRKLILSVRETPIHKGHLKLMTEAADLGAVLFPPIPAFYHMPKTIDDIINHNIGKILDLFKIEHTLFKRWDNTYGL